MKKFILMAALVVATLSANAQGVFIKPMAGGSLTKFTGSNIDDLKMKFGFVGGTEVGYQFNDYDSYSPPVRTHLRQNDLSRLSNCKRGRAFARNGRFPVRVCMRYSVQGTFSAIASKL